MKQRITRRGLALLAAAAALPAPAQVPSTPPPIPATPEEELTAARAQARSSAEQLAKVPLTTAVEPAVVFRA